MGAVYGPSLGLQVIESSSLRSPSRMTRQLFSTGFSYEPLIGCSRAVRSGDLLTISATAPLAADGKTTAAPGAYGQAKRCLEIIARVIGHGHRGHRRVIGEVSHRRHEGFFPGDA
jgi:enamine deaminase RidA (YjgF/YER057c/UK114 family)